MTTETSHRSPRRVAQFYAADGTLLYVLDGPEVLTSEGKTDWTALDHWHHQVIDYQRDHLPEGGFSRQYRVEADGSHTKEHENHKPYRYDHTEPDGTAETLYLHHLKPVFGLWSGQLLSLDAEAAKVLTTNPQHATGWYTEPALHVWFEPIGRRLLITRKRLEAEGYVSDPDQPGRLKWVRHPQPVETIFETSIGRAGTYSHREREPATTRLLVYDFSLGSAGQATSWAPPDGFPVIEPIKRRPAKRHDTWEVLRDGRRLGTYQSQTEAKRALYRIVRDWRNGGRQQTAVMTDRRGLHYHLKLHHQFHQALRIERLEPIVRG